MVRYAIVRRINNDSAQIEKDSFGICACSVSDGLVEIVSCVDNISDDIVWVRTLSDKLNQYEVDPIHLYDIVEDELYALRA